MIIPLRRTSRGRYEPVCGVLLPELGLGAANLGFALAEIVSVALPAAGSEAHAIVPAVKPSAKANIKEVFGWKMVSRRTSPEGVIA